MGSGMCTAHFSINWEGVFLCQGAETETDLQQRAWLRWLLMFSDSVWGFVSVLVHSIMIPFFTGHLPVVGKWGCAPLTPRMASRQWGQLAKLSLGTWLFGHTLGLILTYWSPNFTISEGDLQQRNTWISRQVIFCHFLSGWSARLGQVGFNPLLSFSLRTWSRIPPRRVPVRRWWRRCLHRRWCRRRCRTWPGSPCHDGYWCWLFNIAMGNGPFINS